MSNFSKKRQTVLSLMTRQSKPQTADEGNPTSRAGGAFPEQPNRLHLTRKLYWIPKHTAGSPEEKGIHENCHSRSEAQEPDVFLQVLSMRHLAGEQTGTSEYKQIACDLPARTHL